MVMLNCRGSFLGYCIVRCIFYPSTRSLIDAGHAAEAAAVLSRAHDLCNQQAK